MPRPCTASACIVGNAFFGTRVLRDAIVMRRVGHRIGERVVYIYRAVLGVICKFLGSQRVLKECYFMKKEN